MSDYEESVTGLPHDERARCLLRSCSLPLDELVERMSAEDAVCQRCDGGTAERVADPGPFAGDLATLEEVERAHVGFVVRATKTYREAARVLGIGERTLYRRVKA